VIHRYPRTHHLELAATPQDSAFHAEGDVWTHTKLAIQALVDSPAYAAGDLSRSAARRARYLRAGTSFAWNATNLTPALRGQLLELFRGYRARTHIVYCEAVAEDLSTRDRSREARVPARVIERMLERWTVPDLTEAHAVTYAVPPGPSAGPGGVSWPPTP
jgi:hypothetical protein